MNTLHKTVFSQTLTNVEWAHTTLVKTDIIESIKLRKQESGKPLVILGSGMLVKELTKHRLIDEYQLMVNPVLLGSGNHLFDERSGKLQLKLVESRPFSSGNILLRYQLDDER
jgi:dihydrofolate reductase